MLFDDVSISLITLTCLILSAVMLVRKSTIKSINKFILSLMIFGQIWFAFLWYYFLKTNSLFLENNELPSLIVAESSLILPILYLKSSTRDFLSTRIFLASLAILTLDILLHFLLSNSCSSCFFSTNNNNLHFTLIYQLIVSLTLFIIFLVRFTEYLFVKSENKKTILIIFISFAVFYLHDISTIIERIFVVFNIFEIHIAAQFEVLFHLFLSFTFLYMSFSTRMAENKLSNIFVPKNKIFEVQHLKTTWAQIVQESTGFPTAIQNSIAEIDQKNLSETEKLYLYLRNFDLTTKEAAEILCVSTRTIETNRYRLNKKI